MGGKRFVDGLYQALFSFRLARSQVITDDTLIKLVSKCSNRLGLGSLGSKCYYRWDLYYTWVQLLHLFPLHSNPWKLHFLFLLHLTGCQTWIRRLQLKRPWSRAGGFYFSWGFTLTKQNIQQQLRRLVGHHIQQIAHFRHYVLGGTNRETIILSYLLNIPIIIIIIIIFYHFH